MKGTASYLMKFLDGSQKRFIVPVYQRNYDWKKDNCKQLFDDLVSVIMERKDTQVSKNYRKLADGLYFCPTSSSTWNKMSILKRLFQLYGIDEEDLSFGLWPKKEDTIDIVNAEVESISV